MRPVPPITYDLLRHFEGLHDGDRSTPILEPVRDPVGFWTSGWGHLISRNVNLPPPAAITIAKAEQDLIDDAEKAARAVLRLVPVPLTDGQYAALIDFTYNLGAGNLQISALRQKLLRQEYAEAADQFPRWVRAGGRVLRGLVLRRAAERAVFLGSTPDLE